VQTSKPKRISVTVHAGQAKIEREKERRLQDFFFSFGLKQQAITNSRSLGYLSLHNNTSKEIHLPLSKLELPDQHLALICASHSVGF